MCFRQVCDFVLGPIHSHPRVHGICRLSLTHLKQRSLWCHHQSHVISVWGEEDVMFGGCMKGPKPVR